MPRAFLLIAETGPFRKAHYGKTKKKVNAAPVHCPSLLSKGSL